VECFALHTRRNRPAAAGPVIGRVAGAGRRTRTTPKHLSNVGRDVLLPVVAVPASPWASLAILVFGGAYGGGLVPRSAAGGVRCGR
jgi:hypothetical protein